MEEGRTPSRRRWIRGLFWAAVVALGAASVLCLVSAREDQKRSRLDADLQRAHLVDKVHDSLMYAKDLADKLVEGLPGRPDPDQVRDDVRRLLREHPAVLGAGISYDPAWLSREGFGRSRLSFRCLREHAGMREEDDLGYDYLDSAVPNARWYTLTAHQRQATWSAPYFSRAAQTEVIAYARPVFDSDSALVGVACAIYSLADLRSRIAGAGLGRALLISGDGTILHHPRMDMMDGRSNVRTLGRKTQNASMLAFADSMERGSVRGSIAHRSTFTKEASHLVYDRIPGLGWYVLTVSRDAGSEALCAHRRAIFLLVSAAFALLALGWCLFHPGRPWASSIGFSAILTAGIVALCWLSVAASASGSCVSAASAKAGADSGCSRTTLSNSFSAGAFMNSCFELDGAMRSVPTGILVQTASFANAYSFAVSGYVWQKYRERSDTSFLGVEFPESESFSLAQAYDDSVGPREFVRGWRFSATVRQPFDYRLYPLDRQEVWIRMQPRGLNEAIMLEPDFASYHRREGALTGVDQNLVLPQWTLQGANFSYARNRSSSDYGRSEFRNRGEYPELYFSLHVRRNVFDAFVSQFVPLLVIILMLFSILWVGRKKDEPGLLGFNALSGTSGCSAVFFIVIYNHISLRNTLGTPGVVYMEFYFFATYAAILFVSLNSILVATDHRSWFINHGDNLVSRLIYWPLVTGGLFAATFLVFL